MRKILLAVLIAVGAAPAAAFANSVSIGYDNVGVSAGGINATAPAGMLAGTLDFGSYAAKAKATIGSGNGLNYQNYGISAEKRIGFAGGEFTPRLLLGYTHLGAFGGNISAAYAGFGAGYQYPLNQFVTVGASAAAGRDFATHVTGLNTVGSLFYQAKGYAKFSGIGPGALKIGYEYRHLPISMSHNLHLNTNGVFADYSVHF